MRHGLYYSRHFLSLKIRMFITWHGKSMLDRRTDRVAFTTNSADAGLSHRPINIIILLGLFSPASNCTVGKMSRTWEIAPTLTGCIGCHSH